MLLYNEGVIYKWLTELYRMNRAPIRTVILADFAQYSDRYIRRTLSQLEQRGIVQRRGTRGGWLPVAG